MPIIKKSNEKLIDYCGCYTVEKKFSNRADWLLGCRSWHKMGSFHCCWSYWKKSQAWTFVVSSSWWTILLISQQIFTRGTNTNQLKSFALYVHWKDEASNATDYSEAASFFSLRRSLVFYSKALHSSSAKHCITTFCRLLDSLFVSKEATLTKSNGLKNLQVKNRRRLDGRPAELAFMNQVDQLTSGDLEFEFFR